MIKLKIISNGTSVGTKIVNSKTGEEIEGVRSIEWSICYGEFPVVKIEVEASYADLFLPLSPKLKIVKAKKKKVVEIGEHVPLYDMDDDIPF